MAVIWDACHANINSYVYAMKIYHYYGEWHFVGTNREDTRRTRNNETVKIIPTSKSRAKI